MSKALALTAGVLALLAQSMPAAAQSTVAEVRLRKIEADVRALQRQVFPGEGKVFSPEIAPGTPQAAAAGQPATTAVNDVLSRMDSLENQVRRLTAQVEESSNRLRLVEARLPALPAVNEAATASAAAGAPAPGTAAPPAIAESPGPEPVSGSTASNLAAMTGGASAPRAAATPAAALAPRPARAAPASAQRVAAVRAIAKPQTDDAGDDEYSYGFRLWDAKFYPEAQQQLKLMVERYPRHSRISYARNLLGRAYLDDGKPQEAATWFLQNYNADHAGARAPDSLLYLAEAMRRLNDTRRACIALAEFAQNYPRESIGRLKDEYDATRNGVKCN